MQRRTAAMLALLSALSACRPPPASGPPGNDGRACEGEPSACERRMLEAAPHELPGLWARYAERTGEPAWRELLHALGRHRTLVVHERGEPPRGMAGYRLTVRPRAVPLEALLLAAGRAAGTQCIFLLTEKGARQLVPDDPLLPFALGLDASFAARPDALAEEAELAELVRAALRSASELDYVGAARAAERLRARLARVPPRAESALRARFALELLRRSGLVLGRLEPATRFATAEPTSPYAAWLAVGVDGPGRAWARHRAVLERSLGPEKIAALDSLFATAECRPPSVPPNIEGAADLAWTPLLAGALDRTGPDRAASRGRLPLPDWLDRYDRAVQAVQDSATGWAYAKDLLVERGEIHGLSAAGTSAYRRVTELGARHLAALGKLAELEPSRFDALVPVALAQLPGVAGDRQLLGMAAGLVETSIKGKIEAATDPAGVLDAAFAAVAAAGSAPTALQASQLAALSDALHGRLAAGFGGSGGWAVAGLHLADGLLAALLGQRQRLAEAAPAAAEALRGAGSHASLARLAASAARYAALLESGALDAGVANVGLYPPERQAARRAWLDAVRRLDDVGPQTPAERELARRIGELGDGVMAVVAARLGGERGRCGGAPPELSDALARLARQRRALLDSDAFERAQSGWAARARVVALLLSDALDLSAGRASYRVPAARASALLEAGLGGWIDAPARDLVAGAYLLARSAAGQEPVEPRAAARSALRAVRALAALFGAPDGQGLWTSLAELAGSIDLADEPQLGAALVAGARAAYRRGATLNGDVLLMASLAMSLAQQQTTSEDAIALARTEDRPLLPALLIHSAAAQSGGDPPELAEAARRAAAASCSAVDPEPVLAARRALSAYRAGEREAGLSALDRMLVAAESRGLDVPRQVLRFRQQAGDAILRVEQSASLGGHLLPGSSALGLGLGLASGGEPGSSFEARLAEAGNSRAREDAARYFAHAAGVAAVLHFAGGDEQGAVSNATRAVGALAIGVRLGEARVVADGRTASWARDAVGVLALAGQQAAERGHAFVAGDLFTLARAGLGEDADDERVRRALAPLPAPLRGLPDIEPPAERAARSLETLAAGLSCTDRAGDGARLERPGCRDYPLALALRAADGLPALPRLSGGNACPHWQALDRFLGLAEQGQYDPDRLREAADALMAAERWSDAAALLSRYRHPHHCSPELVAHARRLSPRRELGLHLRADLLSIAANCDGSPRADRDLIELAALVRRHPLPARSLEVLAFAARTALERDRWEAIYAISHAPGFVAELNMFGPELGSAALLVQHAAAVGAAKPLDEQSALPHYRLLCTTFPAKERGPTCAAIAVLRSDQPRADKLRAAKRALAELVRQAAASVRP